MLIRDPTSPFVSAARINYFLFKIPNIHTKMAFEFPIHVYRTRPAAFCPYPGGLGQTVRPPYPPLPRYPLPTTDPTTPPPPSLLRTSGLVVYSASAKAKSARRGENTAPSPPRGSGGRDPGSGVATRGRGWRLIWRDMQDPVGGMVGGGGE